MSKLSVTDSYKAHISEPTDYHTSLLCGDKLWLFGLKYEEQETIHWGHRIAAAGTYGIAFDTAKMEWEEMKEFPPLSTEENVQEVFFVLQGDIHILLADHYDGINYRKIYKWTGEGWEERPLQQNFAIEAASKSKERQFDIFAATGNSDTEKYLINDMDGVIRVQKLTVGEDGLVHIDQVPIEFSVDEFGRYTPVSAVVSGDRLLLSYGMQGCGFMWQHDAVICADLSKNTAELLVATAPDEASTPKFNCSGSNANALSKSGEWLHITGSALSGLHGSRYESGVWALTNLSESPVWKWVADIPEDMYGPIGYNVEKNVIYSAGNTNTTAISLDACHEC